MNDSSNKGSLISKESLSVFLVLAGSILIRAYQIHRPLLGNFAVYQIAQAMVAKSFLASSFKTILYPEVFFVVAGKPAYMMLYYPLSSLVAAVSYALFGGTLDFWGRFQAIVFFSLAAWYLYLLVRHLLNPRAAFWSLVFFALSPLTIIYGQSFQNEIATIFFTVFFFYYLIRSLEGKSSLSFFLSAIGFAFVLLTRPNCLYLGLPALYLVFLPRDQGGLIQRLGKALGIMLIGGLMALPWYLHAWNVSMKSSNIYSTLFVQLESRASFLPPVIFSAHYYLQLFDLLAGIALTPVGFVFFLLGVFLALHKNSPLFFFFLWVFAFSLSSILIARKLVDHNLYLLHFVVAAVPLAGSALAEWESAVREKKSRLWVPIFCSFLFFISMRYAYAPAFVTPEKSRKTLQVAKIIEKYVPKDSKIIEATPDSMSILYYSNRLGWNFFFQNNREVPYHWKNQRWAGMTAEKLLERNEAYETSVNWLEYLRKEGGEFFIALNPQDFENDTPFATYVKSRYPSLNKDGDSFLFYDLRYPAQNSH